jgi:GMP synthase (glutamine-hydrolysing)
MNKKKPQIAVVADFGGQYANLIAKKIRALGVRSLVVPYAKATPEYLIKLGAKALVLSGGFASVNDENAPSVDPSLLNMGIPVLGICYGAQLIAKLSGGTVVPAEKSGEYNMTDLEIEDSAVLPGRSSEKVLMSHWDKIVGLPRVFRVTGRTRSCPVAMFECRAGRCGAVSTLYGVQFHPEVSDTKCGDALFGGFLNAAGFARDWRPAGFIDEAVDDIERRVGGRGIVAGLSGGVDSFVMSRLLNRALGSKAHFIFVDHGFMRAGESEEVISRAAGLYGGNFIPVNAAPGFFAKLKGVTNPERQRKIFGDEFVDVFAEAARKTGAECFGQRTLYTDRVESGATGAAVIKTHHNLVGKIKEMGLELVEPLRELYKDDVREIAAVLGFPEEIAQRQPFPGPGLALYNLGEVNQENTDKARTITSIVEREIQSAHKDGIIGRLPQQYFGFVAPKMEIALDDWRISAAKEIIGQEIGRTPALSVAFSANHTCVGVKGDARTDDKILLVSPDEAIGNAERGDVMEVMRTKVAMRLANEIEGVSWCAMNLSSGWHSGTDAYFIRAVSTTDFMTVQAADISVGVLEKVRIAVGRARGGDVYYVLSPKPPATTVPK